MVIAALYALCVIAPSSAVAFGAGGHAAHCFTEEQLGLAHVHQADVGHVHVHADGTMHRHDGPRHHGTPDDSNNPAACCGVFGLTAMAVDPELDLAAPSRESSIVPVSFEPLAGRDPDRINRPPIGSLSL